MTIADLESALRERLDPLDLPRTMTQREVDAYTEQTAVMARRIRAIRVLVADLASIPSTDHDQRWLDDLTAIRQTLCDELLARPPRAYSRHDQGVIQNLKLSIIAIDRGLGITAGTGYGLETLRLGQLLRESGYVAAPPVDGQAFGRLPWFGTLSETEARIKKCTTRRAAAQSALEELLLDDAALQQLAADRAAAAAARNAMPVRKTRGDGTEFWKFPDGHTEEIAVVVAEST